MAKSKKTDPYFVEKPTQKMATITSIGDPKLVGEQVLSALYGAVYTLKFQLKKLDIEMKVGKLTARWPNSDDLPRAEWTGQWGLAVPENTESLTQKVEGYPVGLEWWEYGTIAEILHLGPYADEPPTIARLKQFITDSGYEICGVHEEEYLTKPDAKEMKTLIRYPVKKKE